MLISYRGEVGEPVACQVEMAVHTKALLNQLNIPTYHFHKSEDANELSGILSYCYMSKKPVAVLMDAAFWKGLKKMIRSDVLKTLIPLISDQLLVTNIGLPSQEMHLLDDQPSDSICLAQWDWRLQSVWVWPLHRKKVIALDSDESVLMNFGTLPTIANNVASNLFC